MSFVTPYNLLGSLTLGVSRWRERWARAEAAFDGRDGGGMGKGCSDHAEISLRRVSDEGSRRPPRAQASKDGFPSVY